MRLLFLIFLLVTAIIAASFSLLNPTLVEFNYFIGREQIPLSWLLFISLFIGWLLALIPDYFKIIILKAKIKSLQKQLDEKNHNPSQVSKISTSETN